jgi:hypothetical protein
MDTGHSLSPEAESAVVGPVTAREVRQELEQLRRELRDLAFDLERRGSRDAVVLAHTVANRLEALTCATGQPVLSGLEADCRH